MQAAGIKHDAEKPRWNLLPFDALSYVVKVLTFVAGKYGPDNWRSLADPESRYFSALMRHLTAWKAGEKLDPETGLPHLAHAATNALFLLWLDQCRKPGFAQTIFNKSHKKNDTVKNDMVSGIKRSGKTKRRKHP